MKKYTQYVKGLSIVGNLKSGLMQTLIYGLEAWGKIGKNEGNEIEKVQGKA